jgi:hypothetical protein
LHHDQVPPMAGASRNGGELFREMRDVPAGTAGHVREPGEITVLWVCAPAPWGAASAP